MLLTIASPWPLPVLFKIGGRDVKISCEDLTTARRLPLP